MTGESDLRPLDTKLKLFLVEDLTQSNHSVSLRLQTEEHYGCIGRPPEINARMFQSGKTIYINIYGLVKDEGGFYDDGIPAIKEFELGNMSEGSWTIRINVNGSESSDYEETHLVYCTPEARVVTSSNNKWTYFSHEQYRRVENDIIWGYLRCRDDQCKQIADALLDTLQEIGAQSYHPNPGYYGPFFLFHTMSEGRKIFSSFSINSKGVLSRGEPLGYYDMRPLVTFVYRYSGDRVSLEDTFKLFIQAHTDTSGYSPFTASVYTGTGHYYLYGWTVANQLKLSRSNTNKP